MNLIEGSISRSFWRTYLDFGGGGLVDCICLSEGKSWVEYLTNSYLNWQIYRNSYIPFSVKDLTGREISVYVNPKLPAAIEACNLCQGNLSKISELYKQILGVSSKEFFLVQEQSKKAVIGNFDGKWHAEPVLASAKGGVNSILLTNSLAVRVLLNPDKASSRAQELLCRVNPEGSAIGIISPNKGVLQKVYDLTLGERKDYLVEAGVVPRFKGDTSKKRFKLEEVAKMCAGVALGVQTLHKENIHHLDIKPQNILYDGNGVVCLSDFDGSLQGAKGSFSFTKKMVHFQDRGKGKTEGTTQTLLEKMDIFALGSTFYQWASLMKKGKIFLPYKLKQGYAGSLQKEPILRGVLDFTYTKTQVDMILKMLDPDSEKRPSIEEVVQAFPFFS